MLVVLEATSDYWTQQCGSRKKEITIPHVQTQKRAYFLTPLTVKCGATKTPSCPHDVRLLLSCPNFYILKGVQFRHNFINCCEDKATMAMAKKAWMSGPLFYAWLSHFITRLKERFELSTTSRHLLILDGHNSRVTLEIIHKATEAGI
jgi:hypothetical protein